MLNSNRQLSKKKLASVYCLKKADLNGCEPSHYLRGRSYATSVKKTNSVVTCSIHLMGEFIGEIMSTIIFKQATYRDFFKKLNPTNRHKDKKRLYGGIAKI